MKNLENLAESHYSQIALKQDQNSQDSTSISIRVCFQPSTHSGLHVLEEVFELREAAGGRREELLHDGEEAIPRRNGLRSVEVDLALHVFQPVT